jgi:hypothetical protein
MRKRYLTILFLICSLRAQAQDPVIQLIDIDLQSFWRIYDQFKKDTTQNPFGEYLENGSPALKKYTDHWDKAAHYFKRNIRQNPLYFEQVRNAGLNVQDYQDTVATLFEKFKMLYPEATTPKVYYIGGALTTLCSTNTEGVVIGADLFADSAYRVHENFKALTLDQLPVRTVQCMIQHNSRTAYIGYYLMREAIVEGSVCFLTGLISDEFRRNFTTGKMFRYGEAHEETLVKEFLRRKYDSDFTGWSYWSNGTDRPTGLGAWVGYKITEAYYSNSADKEKAIDEILEINDFEKFLSLSGYTQLFSN